jgi:hypothetical protein
MDKRALMQAARRGTWGLVTALLLVAAQPYTAEAKPLCIANNVNTVVLVLTRSKIRVGRAYAIDGYALQTIPSHAGGVIGNSIENADGTRIALALREAAAWVTLGGSTVGPSHLAYNVIFAGPTLQPGDISIQGYAGGTPATFTVVDCANVPPIP